MTRRLLLLNVPPSRGPRSRGAGDAVLDGLFLQVTVGIGRWPRPSWNPHLRLSADLRPHRSCLHCCPVWGELREQDFLPDDCGVTGQRV